MAINTYYTNKMANVIKQLNKADLVKATTVIPYVKDEAYVLHKNVVWSNATGGEITSSPVMFNDIPKNATPNAVELRKEINKNWVKGTGAGDTHYFDTTLDMLEADLSGINVGDNAIIGKRKFGATVYDFVLYDITAEIWQNVDAPSPELNTTELPTRESEYVFVQNIRVTENILDFKYIFFKIVTNFGTIYRAMVLYDQVAGGYEWTLSSVNDENYKVVFDLGDQDTPSLVFPTKGMITINTIKHKERD